MVRHAVLVVAVAAAAAAPLASAASSPAQYRSELKAACARANSRSQAIANPTTKKETIAALQQTVRIGNELVVELRALDPPSKLSKLNAQAITATRDEVTFLKMLVKRVQGGTSLDKLSKELGAQERKLENAATTVFGALGVSSCAD
jgi:hypothetical protein